MKFKIILVALLVFFIIPSTAFAISTSFMNNAQKWYNENCIRRPDRVRGEDSVLCYAFDKLNELQVALNTQNQKIGELENKIQTLEERIEDLENPQEEPTESITVSSGDIFEIPEGYKSMRIQLKNVSNLPGWAPTVSFDGTIYKEQHRFGGSQLDVTVPILANNYRLNKGGPDDFLADITFNSEPGSQVILLGQGANYPFTSATFDATGFTKILITAGGGDNPQNLSNISLQRDTGGGNFVEMDSTSCDGGAQCGLEESSLEDGTYRVVVNGSGTNAVFGAILRP